MPKIVALGGGKLAEMATLPIDRQIVRLTGKPAPRALFIPTASTDSEIYCENFEKVYGRKLGCPVDTLLLYRNRPDAKGIKAKIEAADLIYVGGGNTLKMMKLWRRLGVDTLLRKAWQRDVVLCGISAGAICWFTSGCSDSRKFSSPHNWKHILVRGMGLHDIMLCPHYHAEGREAAFAEMVRKRGGASIALDDHVALEVVDGGYRAVLAKPDAAAYAFVRANGEVHREPISTSRKHMPLEKLQGS